MKRILTLIVALCGVVALGAQNDAAKVLEKVGQKIGSLGDYRIDFEVKIPATEAPSKGYCLVGGQRYVIDIDGMAQAFDGEAVYMLNPITREVTIDAPRPNSRSLFDNPTKAFDFDPELFAIDRITYEAAMIHLWLTPAEGVLEGVEQVHLVVDSDTMLPSSLSYDFAGAVLSITVRKFESAKASENSFEVAIPSDYEVIDFR
jgi:outer membrane lipoprotein-sorting protein